MHPVERGHGDVEGVEAWAIATTAIKRTTTVTIGNVDRCNPRPLCTVYPWAKLELSGMSLTHDDIRYTLRAVNNPPRQKVYRILSEQSESEKGGNLRATFLSDDSYGSYATNQPYGCEPRRNQGEGVHGLDAAADRAA